MNTFTFWRNNRLDPAHKVTSDALLSGFTAWLTTKSDEYVHHYSSESLIRFYLTDPEGLSSTFEETDFMALYELLRPVVVQRDRVHF